MSWRARTTAALLLLISCAASPCHAKTYPAKPVRLVVGFSAGGAADISARTIGKTMADSLETTFVVENRSGAGGSLAAQIVANAPPDGYTLLWGSVGALTVNPLLQSGMGYDPVDGFAPISQTFTFCNALVTRPDTGISSIANLIARAREKPDTLSFGTQGVGSAGHLSGGLLKSLTGIRLVHVPYKGAPEILTSVVGGEIPLGFVSATAASAMRSRLRVLAVTSVQRDPTLPDVPTMREAGVADYDATFWYGLLAPARTSGKLVALLNREVRAALATASTESTLQRHGLRISPTSPQRFAEIIRDDRAKWRHVLDR